MKFTLYHRLFDVQKSTNIRVKKAYIFEIVSMAKKPCFTQTLATRLEFTARVTHFRGKVDAGYATFNVR